MSLFRPQALAAQADPDHGPLLLVRSNSSWWIVLGAILIAASLITYLCLGHYTRRTTISGILQPASGSVRLVAPTGGTVTELRVVEGQTVRRGDVLFVVSDVRRAVDAAGQRTMTETQSLALEQRRASTQRALEAVATLQSQTETGLRLRLDTLADQLRAVEQEVSLQSRRVDAARRMLERQSVLAQEKFISEAALQEKQDQLEVLQAQHLTAQRQRNELQGAVVALRAELEQTVARSASQTEALRRDVAMLDQESAELDTRGRQVVAAPEDGVVTAITAQLGQQIGTQPLAVLLPAGVGLVAQLFAPPRAAGFIATGQSVRLRYHAYPYQKFGQYTGVVRDVSRTPISPTEIAAQLPLSFATPEAVFRLTVSLERQEIDAYGRSVPLAVGMTVEGDVEQETRRLIEWVIEPLAGLRRHVL